MRRIFLMLTLLWATTNVFADQPRMIVIITHDDIKATNRDTLRQMGILAHSLNIHAPRDFIAYLKDFEPQSQEIDEQIILQRLRTITEEQKMSFFRPAYIIRELGIQKLPVAIFDEGEEIAYGVTDFVEALRIWEQTR